MKFELASITLVVQKAILFVLFGSMKKHFLILTFAETESNNMVCRIKGQVASVVGSL